MDFCFDGVKQGLVVRQIPRYQKHWPSGLVFVLGATRELDHITSSSSLFQKAIRVRKGERNSKSAQGKDHGAPLLRLSGSLLPPFFRQSSKSCVFVPWAKIGKVGSWLVNATSAFSWRHTFSWRQPLGREFSFQPSLSKQDGCNTVGYGCGECETPYSYCSAMKTKGEGVVRARQVGSL